MASDTQSHARSTASTSTPDVQRQRKPSLRHQHLPIFNHAMSDPDEHNTLCHHDHEHETIKSRHHQGIQHPGPESPDMSISLPTTKHAEQAIAPFLAKHIPKQYNPLGSMRQSQTLPQDSISSSTKFCYRHRPDLKCRRQANEPSMEQLQNVSTRGSSTNTSLY